MKQKLIIAFVVFMAAIALTLYLFDSIVIYLVISVIITAILTPIVDYLDNIRIGKFNFPRTAAVPGLPSAPTALEAGWRIG